MLNIIFISFFLSAFLSACGQYLFIHNTQIWQILVTSVFEAAQNSFTIALNLTGILCFWLGLMKIAETSGLTEKLAKFLSPFFQKVMPEVPQNHPAIGSVIMNMAANMLGLDNAATPIGLKAMQELQSVNPKKDTATNAQILFLVLNASSVTILPISIIMYRQTMGSLNPSAVFVPILLATSVSTLTGFLAVAYKQKLPVLNRTVLTCLAGFFIFILSVAFYFMSLEKDVRLRQAESLSNFILFGVIALFIFFGAVKKINVYEKFIEGAKQGFEIAVGIIPYLVAMLVAIAAFRASGVLDFLMLGLSKFFAFLHLDTSFIPAIPTALMKPLSGSGARAMMLETLQTYGADSFEGFVSSVIQGSTETTFYVLAVYFGAVKISKTRSALPCALLADFAGITTAIVLSYFFY